jgi:PAS domain S-box-containing protein
MLRKLSHQVTFVIILLAVFFAAFGAFVLISFRQLQSEALSIASTPGADVQAFVDHYENASHLTGTFLILILLISVGLILNIISVFVVSSKILTEGIERFKRGELDYRIPLNSKNEFGVIAAYLNDAIAEVARSERELRSAEARLRDANVGLEGKVRERTRQLAQSEEKLRHLVEHISDVVTVLTADGNIRYESPSLETVLGYKPEELIGKNIFTLVHPDDRERVEQVFENRKKIRGFAPAIVLRFKHKNGDWRYTEAVNNNLLHDPDISGFLVTSKDITERRQNEEKLRELDDLKNTFIRVVSHQLRTPLNAIRWNLELLLGGELGRVAPRQRDFVRVSHDANTEIIRRIDDLLVAMDIEEGRIQLKKEQHDLANLVESAIIEVRKIAEIKNVRVSFVPPKNRERVDCDSEKLRSVVYRLAENAVRYSKEGGRVAVKLSAKPGHVRLEVADAGIGIPKDEQKRVFIRFYRGSNATAMQPDSSGLGLYIAKYFVEAHGGTMGFVSREGKGSTFWLELPLSA